MKKIVFIFSFVEEEQKKRTKKFKLRTDGAVRTWLNCTIFAFYFRGCVLAADVMENEFFR